MPYRLAADAVLLLHLAFVLAVIFGGLLALRWPRAAWLHLPVMAWGVGIELAGAVCPLTSVENHFRALAGQRGYAGGFVEHYIVPVIYPPALTRDLQFVLAGVVLGVNLLVYGWILYRRHRPVLTEKEHVS
ncbi:MAG: DUF2784 domain-containing protein [Gammaproteobacteria bacterium]|nr:DUF2784 domain-containing protein [Gammaproteobacteria bacterium]MDH4254494.1 DUF2784 domain-containing protein [Gammaproteobacteria bacterium]MDH5309098.1 DUF2784 domain-containing protein [Gammaproteobacteria bacterium]